MTTEQLYRLYCDSYAEFYREHGGVLLRQWRALTPVEAAVIEFASEDAANGTPLRSPASFASSVAAGSSALRPLGLARGAA
jgi:hypothetical protein